MPTVHGEDAALRVLDKESMSEKFKKLATSRSSARKRQASFFSLHPRALRHGAGHRPHRIGQDHHALLRAERDQDRRRQDHHHRGPGQYQLYGITQIGERKEGLDLSPGLRSILRHDPDKIMVGEIRDPETAQIAIQSALTGHLVFTTVHANNVVDVLGRFLNMGVEAYNFVSALNCILAQRLVRLICPHRRVKVRYPTELLEESV
ncbi:MAG: ATPase, T2SS/T4P/T4SS family [Bryobacterales bacterium]